MDTKKIWEILPSLTRAVKKTHDEQTALRGEDMFYGHDFDHALRVANYATLIAPDARTGIVAGAAGLCHNADRILQTQAGVGPFGEVDRGAIENMVSSWLAEEPEENLTSDERSLILQAVLHHDQVNSDTDSAVLITLKDADRLTNIDADIIIRDGQFMGNKTKAVDPHLLLSDPTATYRDPGSILRHLQEFLDWEKEGGFVGIRLPKARHLAQSRFEFLRTYLDTVIHQRNEVGLIPYPKL